MLTHVAKLTAIRGRNTAQTHTRPFVTEKPKNKYYNSRHNMKPQNKYAHIPSPTDILKVQKTSCIKKV